MADFRTERDSMGEVQVPAQAYYGAQTQRAVENFPISGWTLPPALIHALGLVKYACGVANRDLGKLTGTGKNPLDDRAGRRPAAGLSRGGRGKARRRVPRRRVSDRLGHFQQHERQRGDRQPGHRAAGRRSVSSRTSRSIPTIT